MSRKPEQRLNDRLMEALKGLHPIRVENVACAGTPDIAYVGGWIESKVIERFPIHRGTAVRVFHFSPEQRVWHSRHFIAGGKSFVALQVESTAEVFLFNGRLAAEHLGEMPEAQMRSVALRTFRGKIDAATLQRTIA